MKARVVAAAAAALIAGCTAARGPEPASPVVATVSGTAITAREFSDRLRLRYLGFDNRSGVAPGDPDLKMDLLGQIILEEIYLQEAGRLNVRASAGEIALRLARAEAQYPDGGFDRALERNGLNLPEYKGYLARKITVEKLISLAVYSRIKVDRAQALQYFKGHEGEFMRPARVRARQIVVDNRGEAEAILREIRRGADFAQLARARSLSPDSASGGDLGFFSRGEMPPAFEAVVFRMRPGEVSGVVKSPYGYHIFKVEKEEGAFRPSFLEAEPEARERLARKLGEDAFKKWQEGLQARAKVSVNFGVLGRL